MLRVEHGEGGARSLCGKRLEVRARVRVPHVEALAAAQRHADLELGRRHQGFARCAQRAEKLPVTFPIGSSQALVEARGESERAVAESGRLAPMERASPHARNSPARGGEGGGSGGGGSAAGGWGNGAPPRVESLARAAVAAQEAMNRCARALAGALLACFAAAMAACGAREYARREGAHKAAALAAATATPPSGCKAYRALQSACCARGRALSRVLSPLVLRPAAHSRGRGLHARRAWSVALALLADADEKGRVLGAVLMYNKVRSLSSDRIGARPRR